MIPSGEPIASSWTRPWRHLAAILLLAGLLFATYYGVWNHALLDYDDDIHLLKNPYLITGDIAAFWRMPYYGLYIPVVYTFWTLISMAGGGPSAPLMHGVNLFLHLVNGAVLYRIILVLLQISTSSPQKPPSPSSQGLTAESETSLHAVSSQTNMAALLATLCFLLHPLQVEPVAWASGFRDLIGAFFTLLAFMFVLEKSLPNMPRWAGGLGFICFLLAILAKPTSCFLPAAIAIFHLWQDKLPLKRTLRSLWLWFLAVAILIFCERSLQTEGFDPAIAALSLWQKIYVAADAMGFYIVKIICPWPLAADYGRMPTRLPLDAPFMALLAVAVFSLLFLLRRRLPATCRCSLLFAALALMAVSGIVPFAHQQISTVADRYAYLPLAGLAMAAAPLMVRFRWPRLGIVMSVVILLLAFIAHQRTAIWQDNRSFFSDMLHHNPESFNASIGLGVDALAQKAPAAALDHFEKALAQKPTNVTALANLGICLFNLGRYHEILQRVEPWLPDSSFIATVPLSAPEIAVMYLAVGMAKMQLGQAQEAYQRVCVAARIDPQNSSATVFKDNLAKMLSSQPDAPQLICP